MLHAFFRFRIQISLLFYYIQPVLLSKKNVKLEYTVKYFVKIWLNVKTWEPFIKALLLTLEKTKNLVEMSVQ